MASKKNKLKTNAAGDFYVDSNCINCGVSRWIAPDIFDEKDRKSSVYRQPNTPEERKRALMAAVACPTYSIGAENDSIAEGYKFYPFRIDKNVYHCGFHASSSFGATSYFITREEGNVLVDSPRFAKPLVKRLEEMGGIKFMFLTHRDDVADHKKYHEHFGCERILHADDITAKTNDVERKIDGTQPVAIDDDLLAIPVPGHTKGSACLLYKEKFLFTGDHLAWSGNLNHVSAFRNHCWYDWKTQIASMEKLGVYRFEWILPGHGRRCSFPAIEMARQLHICINWMKSG
ncbi:MAG: MBL fold metallo-hydrolase [Nitrospinota bacterium]